MEECGGLREIELVLVCLAFRSGYYAYTDSSGYLVFSKVSAD